MNQIQSFNHPAFGELPVIVVNNVEWFGATEAAKALSFTNPHKAIENHVETEDCTVHTVLTNGGTQQKKFINESGLYSLILGAAKQGNNLEIRAKAKEFKRWVTSEVLPSIRKHGAYMTQETLEKALTSPDFLIQLATRLKEEQEKRIAAERKLEEQKPLVGFAETCLASKDSLLVRELAKVASKQGITIGQNRLYKKLREWKLIMPGSTEPYQHAIDAGYFEVVQSGKETVAGHMIFRTTRVTPKGQVYIIDRLKREYQAVGQGGR